MIAGILDDGDDVDDLYCIKYFYVSFSFLHSLIIISAFVVYCFVLMCCVCFINWLLFFIIQKVTWMFFFFSFFVIILLYSVLWCFTLLMRGKQKRGMRQQLNGTIPTLNAYIAYNTILYLLHLLILRKTNQIIMIIVSDKCYCFVILPFYSFNFSHTSELSSVELKTNFLH